ncbi:MAG TPA: L-2-hydroxyglutarate oxidase [Sedimentisphaerales bacterium]|nr:L-2-hydroxyglutarate oxidase [Sedimentisphaerales bacterium]
MKQKYDFDIVVIGGGIVGLASAYKIVRNHPGISIAVLEKEDKLAAHQTGHNSGVIHSGLYYKPGSNKAKTCAKGRKELVAFAKEHGIRYEICGKIIIATKEKELTNLEKVFRNGLENEIEGIEKIGTDEINEVEPFCHGIAGIRVPCTGIIDFTEVARKLAELIEAEGKNKVLSSHKVVVCDKHDYFTNVVTNSGTLATRYVINCGGLQCDRIAKMCGVETKMRIVPFRGDYYELTEQAKEKVQSLIYPVPDPELPFLGVHFTRRIDGSVECGPNAVFSFKREGYGKTDFSFRDTWDSLSYWGTWKMFFRHWKYGLGEYARAFSKKLFLRQLQRLIPSLQADDIKPGNTGVRAQAVDLNGEPIDDFRIERREGSIHVLNAPSPAATASLAIGEHINQIATEYFKLQRK